MHTHIANNDDDNDVDDWTEKKTKVNSIVAVVFSEHAMPKLRT